MSNKECIHIIGVELIQYDGGREIYEKDYDSEMVFLDDFYFFPYCPLCARINPEKYKYKHIIGE